MFTMEKIRFIRKTWASGNTKMVVSIPIELITYLDLKDNCDIVLMPDESKKGKFIALWKKDDEKN